MLSIIKDAFIYYNYYKEYLNIYIIICYQLFIYLL